MDFEVPEIMSAILKTAGPVSTLESVKSTSRSLHLLPATTFLEAASQLETANLGRLIKVTNKKVFIKRLPTEVHEVLGGNPDLCTADVYATRYAKPTAKAIGLTMRAKLVQMKLVSKNCFM